jgi:hypothetical protein
MIFGLLLTFCVGVGAVAYLVGPHDGAKSDAVGTACVGVVVLVFVVAVVLAAASYLGARYKEQKENAEAYERDEAALRSLKETARESRRAIQLTPYCLHTSPTAQFVSVRGTLNVFAIASGTFAEAVRAANFGRVVE